MQIIFNTKNFPICNIWGSHHVTATASGSEIRLIFRVEDRKSVNLKTMIWEWLGSTVRLLQHQVASEINGTKSVAMAMVIILTCRQKTFYRCWMECSKWPKEWKQITTAHDADIHHTTYHIHPVEVINELGHFCWQYVTAFLIRMSCSPSPTVNYFCSGIRA